jgi:hypothetical protein
LNIHGHDISQTEIHTAKTLIPEPTPWILRILLTILAGINFNIGDITLSGRIVLSRWLNIALKDPVFYLE